jgi:hypothetical protein
VTEKARPGVVVALSIWWKKLTADGANANDVTSQGLTDLGARLPSMTHSSRLKGRKIGPTGLADQCGGFYDLRDGDWPRDGVVAVAESLEI